MPIAGFLLAGAVFGPGGWLVEEGLQPGDRLVLIGEGERFVAAAPLFRTDSPA